MRVNVPSPLSDPQKGILSMTRFSPTAAAGLCFAALVALPEVSHASGFMLYDQSAEAAAMGSAVVASTREPASIWYNPAGISFLPGYQISATAIGYESRIRFVQAETGAETKVDPALFIVPSVFATGQIADWLHAGIGVYSAYGLGAHWPDNWIGRDHSLASNMTAVNFNPTLSFRLSGRLSVGVGFDVTRASVDVTNGLPQPVGGTLRIGGAGWGYGANAGVMYHAIPNKLHLGLAYRSRMKLNFSGRADFDPGRIEFARGLPDQGGASDITTPDIITAGYVVWPWRDVAFAMDASYIFWSTYDTQTLDFERTPDATLNNKYHNSWIVRAGADMPLGLAGWRVRTGLLFEENPARAPYLSPSLPSAHILDVSAGVGYAKGWFKADLGYLVGFAFPSKSTTGAEGPEGTYYSVSQLLALTLTGRFGQPAAEEPKR
jgi:long-chain fatty acid transport protein